MKLASKPSYLIGIVLALVLSGCGGSGSSGPSVTSVVIDPATTSTIVGNTVSLTAKVTVTGSAKTSVTWGSSDATIATVSDQGVVTGVHIGTATITATSTADSKKQGTATIIVNGLADSVSILPASPPKLAIKKTLQLSASVTGAPGSENISQAINWTSDTTTVATVDASGVVTGVAAGTAKITAASAVTPVKKASVTIEVTPLLTLSYSSSPYIATITRPLINVNANVAGGDGNYSYSDSGTLPTGLSLDTKTGAITGKPTTPAPTATPYTITVTDGIFSTATAIFTLTVNDVPTIAPITPIQITRTKFYGGTAPTTTGGTPTLTFTIAPPLPTGLNLDPTTGAITGTPTVASATANYTLTVTDNNQAKGSQALSLTVNALPTISGYADATLTAGVAFISATPVVAGGSPTFQFTISPNLPSGLAINPNTGVISGIPAAASAQTTYTVTVTDGSTATATTTFKLLITN